MSEQETAPKAEATFTHALLIELDYVAVSLRPVEFEAIKRGIEPKGIELTQAAFCHVRRFPQSSNRCNRYSQKHQATKQMRLKKPLEK